MRTLENPASVGARRPLRHGPFVLGALLIVFGAACTIKQPDTEYAGMSAQQRSVVHQLLRSHANWRLARDADSKGEGLIRAIRDTQPNFDPFFTTRGVRGADSDFAVVLTRNEQFTVYYFRRSVSSYLPPQEVATVDWLNDGRIQLRGDTLDIGVFQSDEYFLFVWNPNAKQMDLVRE